MKGENFLDVANHPTMTYRTTAIRQDGEVIIADGELTIKGITRPMELAVEVNGFGPDPYGGTRAGLSATGEINRTDWGITANMAVRRMGGPVSGADWSGASNLRDLGGREMRGGGLTASGRVFRSAAPEFMTGEGWRKAKAAVLRTVIDLRNAPSKIKPPDTMINCLAKDQG